MKKMLLTSNANGGLGKTLFTYHCWLFLTSWRYQLLFEVRRPQRYLQPKAKWKSGTKTSVFARRR